MNEQKILAIEHPHESLFTYYAISSLLLGPFFFLFLVPMYFRYHTMRYRFDEEGVVMRWGILFRKEISLTYARIQDIHLSSNLVERWLGLAKVEIQTASGSSEAEMTIEGLKEFEEVRDFLYLKMRGARKGGGKAQPAAVVSQDGGGDELAATLLSIAGEVREIRELLARGSPREGESSE